MDFTQITTVLNSGSTGIFVSLVLSLAGFVTERKRSEKQATVDEYKEWLQSNKNKEFLEGQANLLLAIEGQDEQAQLLQSCIETVMRHIECHTEILSEIAEQTNLLPDMSSKINYMVDKLSQYDSPTVKKGQIAVCARVFDKLAEGLVGSGVKVMMKKQLADVNEGTIMVVWKLGTQSPQMMLVDFIGSIHANRISLILNNDASINLQVYDSEHKKIEVISGAYPACQHLVILAVWKSRHISLWINGDKQGEGTMSRNFDYLGPVCLFGMDIEDNLSADGVRWTLPGEDVGLNFKKDGIWHGSRLDSVMLWERALDDQEIAHLSADPFAMFRPRLCNNGKCPDCGSPVMIDRDGNNREPDERIKRLDGSRATREDFSPRPPAVWCVCTKCGRPCLSKEGFPV
jgi:hypothetical protein